MNIQQISSSQEQVLLDTFREVIDWKAIGPFCVDGRDGEVAFTATQPREHLFVQGLGGSLLICVIEYIRAGGSFDEVQAATIRRLTEAGFGCGVHRGSHAVGDKSDCGFADNLQKIITRFATEATIIAERIDLAAPGVRDQAVWSTVVGDVLQRAGTSLPSGESIVANGVHQDASLQTLAGDHAEIAALVNTVPGTTLDTKALVDSGVQAFNLDLWYTQEQARALSVDESYAVHVALGLYVATEMVLVGDSKAMQLPIVVHST